MKTPLRFGSLVALMALGCDSIDVGDFAEGSTSGSSDGSHSDTGNDGQSSATEASEGAGTTSDGAGTTSGSATAVTAATAESAASASARPAAAQACPAIRCCRTAPRVTPACGTTKRSAVSRTCR